MIQIQHPKAPWEIVHIDLITALPPGGDKSFNFFLLLEYRYSKTPMLLPFNKDDTVMGTAITICKKLISHTGLSKNIRSYRDPKFTSALWKNINNVFETKLSFSTAYHPQTDGLEEGIIQTLGYIIGRFCHYGLEFKDFDGFTHDWCTPITSLERAYKTSIHQ
ncbi:hypothetical protein O181_005173 [Austropuccinia psidii MF-1]|uniref:Integrase catalytic domain-containing protein n=1 Tax=Austropuccinia psidii MF-1 TaxID=1389203 RepID=A0A9Q3GF99_9BASI|nr:hypothetical protein [Austropuccinia psidii MF-1]